ncbi:MAG: glycoside hydrolase family 97 catalytic domain-containing protein, partial [Woeseiaceae bacterium]
GRRFNRYEYLYNTTGLEEIVMAHTPMTVRLPSGTHLSIHEAALVDYAAFVLDQRRPNVFQANLTPWSDGIRVKAETPFKSSWRTIQIAPDAKGLLNSSLILNLNEPNALGDVSWVEPGKYVGIWWGMHLGVNTWGSGPKHGATTEETKRYIDFAAKYGFDGVLVEGWNIGWDGDWYSNGDVFSFTEAYPDFDLEEITDYAAEKGVRLIGHHETSGAVTNYERQMLDAYELYESLGVRQVKTGYVADAGGIKRVDENGVAHYEWHDGQFNVNHHLRALKEAAKHKISLNPHEPIKDTGLRRTYPNWLAREGGRGQEYNAWGEPPNPPEHTAILPYTRMLSGPMDFTPGIFDLTFKGEDSPFRVKTTLAKQLALYVVIYSPIQMAADLPENYEERLDAFQFIVDVPTDWEESIALAGEVGDFVAIARKERDGDHWYLGALTDEEARELSIPLSFLDAGATYTAEIYRDGDHAHWHDDPYDLVIEQR